MDPKYNSLSTNLDDVVKEKMTPQQASFAEMMSFGKAALNSDNPAAYRLSSALGCLTHMFGNHFFSEFLPNVDNYEIIYEGICENTAERTDIDHPVWYGLKFVNQN
mmetsp:Transcript_5686/g.8736  ORF Transcript_5686/g.8736 Transcript_5686/m.8736 type:complete len:106 (-) Transcript_5686:143-460(-)